jgi:beta-fructofuranosidase
VYPEGGFHPSEIGDVDVVEADGRFHLFHLVIPNHDLIAHAVSDDGLRWRRERNALFVGDPGAFDDDMLWTMHVSPDPAGGWRMLYTGLSRGDQGRVQRVGLARSDDLTRWEKVEGGGFPLALDHPAYESGPDPRGWTSFRDPFAVETDGGTEILAAARVAHGPPLRRGCVARLGWDGERPPRPRAPLHHPNRYDDVEVPALFGEGGAWWLIGSIREDRKVHVWRAEEPGGPFAAPSDNVLLPQGNYAARPSRPLPDGTRLLWNVFVSAEGRRLMAPPKRLEADGERLIVRSYDGFDARVQRRLAGEEAGRFEPVCGVPGTEAAGPDAQGGARLVARSGAELFLLPSRWRDVRMRLRLRREGAGKQGLLLRVDERGEGYHLSLSPDKALAEMRVWTARADRVRPGASQFDYRPLQGAASYLRPEPLTIEAIAFGGYLEASIDGEVVLSLADDTVREGRFGLYVESGAVAVEDLEIELLRGPEDGGYRLREEG